TTGSGGLLVGVNATKATAKATGHVSAYIGGSGAIPLPDGDVNVSAQSNTRQFAGSLGVAVGLIGVGASIADAKSDDTTTAALDSGVTTNAARAGTLSVSAYGIDNNISKTVAGSGGVIAGNASLSTVTDSAKAETDTMNGLVLHTGGLTIQS